MVKAVIILLWAGSVYSAPVIESIEGDKVVIVKTAEGNRVGVRGTELKIGDRVKTGPKASAKVRFEDGSKLLIGRASEVLVAEPVQGIPTQDLVDGEVRGVIRKAPVAISMQGTKEQAPDPRKTPPKFLMRTKSATMGVRGTDFTFATDAVGKAEVHTLEGLVEVAKDEQALLSGKGVFAGEGQMVSADAKSVNAPTAFDRSGYVKGLESTQPDFVAFVRDDPEIAYAQMSRTSGPIAPETGPPAVANGLLMFQMAGMMIRQDNGGELITSEVSWNPSFRLTPMIGVRGHAGIFPLKGRSSSDNFMGVIAMPMVSIKLLGRLLVEAGAGVEFWTRNKSKTGGVFALNLGYKLSDERLLERIFVSFGEYDAKADVSFSGNSMGPSGTTTVSFHAVQIRAGLGLKL